MKRTLRTLIFLLTFLPLTALAAPCDSITADSVTSDTLPLRQRIAALLADPVFERTQVGVCVYDLTADSLLFARGERQLLRPASNEKLVTAITALRTLGTDYRYRTTFALAAEAGTDSVPGGTLYVRAGYDPLLSAGDLRALADSLLARGIRRVDGVVADLTFKDAKRLGWGWCWDDDEQPLTPLLYEGRDRFAEGLRQALSRAGIAWDGTLREGTVPAEASTLCTRLRTVDEVLLPMMKRSDNAMAESLFYQTARHESGPRTPATRRHAAAATARLIRAVGLDSSHYQIADGSGLSLYNYLTPQLLVRLLRLAYRDEAVRRHLLPSLPVAGEDGTLARRMRGTAAQGNVRAKTGTVEGVSTLSGYCTTAAGHVLCFSVMNQGIRHTATGRNFQDRLCRELVK